MTGSLQPRRSRTPPRPAAHGRTRGQSNVVGVAILLGVTVLALGTLTASVGTVVEENAASADQTRVAAGLDDAIRPVGTTGRHRGTIAFTEGRFHTADREIRVLNRTGVVANVSASALAFDARDRGVTVLGGAILRRYPTGATMYRRPPITASRDVLVVGVADLNGSVAIGVSGGTTLALRTTVSHDRTALGNGTYRLAVETATPGPWREYFRDIGATLDPPRDFDDDGLSSVVARFPGDRVGYLVVHEVALEVGDG